MDCPDRQRTNEEIIKGNIIITKEEFIKCIRCGKEFNEKTENPYCNECKQIDNTQMINPYKKNNIFKYYDINSDHYD